MAKKDSVNVSIFTALKIGEKAKNVPVLLMSNPGMGKSTTVAIFAKHRGYHLQLLKGNSTPETEIIGYDVVPTENMTVEVKDSLSTVHMRPSWFSEILKKEEQGIPSLLFLDELTTAPEHVQAALLQLVFDRKCGDENLPESTLVVAAGNYIQNLSNQMNLIPPLMNRFMIYNIEADDSDIDSFLCRYKGAIASTDGKVSNQLDNLKNILIEMDKKEKFLDEGTKNKIGEYIERQVAETARALMVSGERSLSFKVTDLQSIYGDTIDDAKLYGFATLRTLGYLVDVTLASYICFGKAGLLSDAYSLMIDGLCGVGVSRDPKTKEVKKTILTPEFKESMKTVANDIDKMNNGLIPVYEKFFVDILQKSDKKSGWEVPELTSVMKKFEELIDDPTLKDVERPINSDLVNNVIEAVYNSTNSTGITNLKVSSRTTPEEWLEILPPEKLAGIIHKWNAIAKLFTILEKFVTADKINYKNDVLDRFNKVVCICRTAQYRLKVLNQLVSKKAVGYEKIVPDTILINTNSKYGS